MKSGAGFITAGDASSGQQHQRIPSPLQGAFFYWLGGTGWRDQKHGPASGLEGCKAGPCRTTKKRFRLFGRLHRTILYAFARLRRGAIFGAGLLWFSARITPIRANIVGPSLSATSSSASIAASHSSASCSCLRQLRDVFSGVAERDQLLAIGQFDWIEKSLIPRHRFITSTTSEIIP